MRHVSKLALALLALAAGFSSTASAQWVRTSMPDTSGVMCILADGGYLFVGTVAGGVYVSTDSGATWTQQNNGLGDLYVSGLAIMGTNIFAGTDNGVYRSTDMGKEWTPAGLVDANESIVNIAVSDTTIFAVTNMYLSADQYYLHKSTDMGETWSEVQVTPSPYTSVYGIAVNDTAVFAGTLGHGLYYSTSSGASWSRIGSQGNGFIVATNEGKLWASDSLGLEYSTDGGPTWISVNTGLPFGVLVKSIAFSGGNVFIGTYQNGVYVLNENHLLYVADDGLPDNTDVEAIDVIDSDVYAGTSRTLWRRPLSELVSRVVTVVSPPPFGYSLLQNYPNPFNPATTIRFQLPRDSQVTLKVYDVLGREVATLVNGVESAGRYRLVLDASRLPSGVYFYRLQAGKFTETRKLMVLR